MNIEIESADSVRVARINELCHRMTVADTRDVRVWLCAELKREIEALNDARLSRLNEALSRVGA